MTLQQRLTNWIEASTQEAETKERRGNTGEAAALRQACVVIQDRLYGNTTPTQLREAVQMAVKSMSTNADYKVICYELTKIVGKAK